MYIVRKYGENIEIWNSHIDKKMLLEYTNYRKVNEIHYQIKEEYLMQRGVGEYSKR